MELRRYDIIEAELKYGTGSIQRKRRPYIIVSNDAGNTNADIITVMPLTHIYEEASPCTWLFTSSIRNRTIVLFNDFGWTATDDMQRRSDTETWKRIWSKAKK